MSTIDELRQSLGASDTEESTDWSALVAGGIGLVCLLGAFGSFLLNTGLTAVFLLGLVLVVTYGWYAHQAETAKSLTFVATASTIVTMGLIVVFIFREALPMIQQEGLSLVIDTSPPLWDTSDAVYSLTPLMWGTFVTTVIAMAIAGPLGVAGALFISEIAPGWLREVVKPGIEILAGIPSIVYGFLGLTVINTYFADSDILGLAGLGSLFAVGLMIGLMALPTVVSVAEDALASVPESMKSGSLALGSTDWQTMTDITIPAAFSGVSAAVLLGVGRAIGETMAATVMLGNIVEFPDPIYDVFGNSITLTSAIASQYGDAGEVQLTALFAAGVVLFVTVLAISVGSQVIEARMEHKLGGQQ